MAPDNVDRQVDEAIAKHTIAVALMLRLKSLHLKNFGAFKGEQSFSLPDAEGVAVFYGENMRGKTTLLNAFRFALFGKILGTRPQGGVVPRHGQLGGTY